LGAGWWAGPTEVVLGWGSGHEGVLDVDMGDGEVDGTPGTGPTRNDDECHEARRRSAGQPGDERTQSREVPTGPC
jgi:hypothetical protein